MDEFSNREFANLLTVAIRRIGIRESKTIQMVQDELGYTLGKKGGAVIEYWRKGHLPRRSSEIEVLTHNLIRRGNMDRAWLEQFLYHAKCNGHTRLYAELFPEPPAAAAAGSSSKPSLKEQLPATCAGNVPVPLTPLIGRERDVSKARQYFAQPTTRLLTFTGPPGVGKTRLALHLAGEMQADFKNDRYFVSLAALVDPERFMPSIAQTLGVTEAGSKSLWEAMAARLRHHAILLVLDNMEQVLGAAAQVSELLEMSSSLRILATSRAPLEIRAERQFPVPPLALPELNHLPDIPALTRCPAIELFIDRAQAADPDFKVTANNSAAVAAICVKLDGLPLGIELVAKQTKCVSPPEILARLDTQLLWMGDGPRDLPVRQQTVRATIEWSYQLLQRSEQDLLARLAIFAGGGTLDAFQTICEDPDAEVAHGPSRLFEDLNSLLNKSLVLKREQRDGSTRFLMLNTIRHYALERLEAEGRAERWRQRHARYYLRLAEIAETGLQGSKQAYWMQRVDDEYENLRAAFEWGLRQNDLEFALRLGGAMVAFWQLRGYVSEGRQWLEALMARIQGPPSEISTVAQAARQFPDELLAKLLCGLGRMARDQGDPDLAFAHLTVSLDLYRQAQDPLGSAQALYHLGVVVAYQKEYGLAQKYLEESLRLYEKLGHLPGIANVSHGMMIVTAQQGRREQTLVVLEKTAGLVRETGDKVLLISTLRNLASWHAECGNYVQAQQLLDEVLALSQETGDTLPEMLARAESGRLAYLQGDPARAQALYQLCLNAFVELKYQPGISTILFFLAELARSQRQMERAARLCGIIEGLHSRIGLGVLPRYQPVYGVVQADTCSALGDSTYNNIREEGRKLTQRGELDWVHSVVESDDRSEPATGLHGGLAAKRRARRSSQSRSSERA